MRVLKKYGREGIELRWTRKVCKEKYSGQGRFAAGGTPNVVCNDSPFEFLSHQVCSANRGTALSLGTFSKLPGTIPKRLFILL